MHTQLLAGTQTSCENCSFFPKSDPFMGPWTPQLGVKFFKKLSHGLGECQSLPQGHSFGNWSELNTLLSKKLCENYRFYRFLPKLGPFRSPQPPHWSGGQIFFSSKSQFSVQTNTCNRSISFFHNIGVCIEPKHRKIVYFYCFSIEILKKSPKITFGVSPTCSPGFPILKMHIQPSIYIQNKW